MTVRNLPFWVSAWLFISGIICTIDALFVILRPHTLPGGKWNHIVQPYNLYLQVDLRYSDLTDTFVKGISLMNLVEVFLNYVVLAIHISGKSGLSVLLAFMVSTMTFSKTVLYFLVSTSLCNGEHFVNHSDWRKTVLLYIIPNGFWIVIPFFCMVATGSILVHSMESGQLPKEKKKSQNHFIYSHDLNPLTPKISLTLRDHFIESGPRSNMAGRILPFWVAVWLVISSIVVTIDALFVLLRPHTLPDGKWNFLFEPYNIFIEVDPRYKDLKDTFVIGQSFMNLLEMCLNIVILTMQNSSKDGLAVLLAFMVSTMTLSKTVFYFLVSSKLCSGHHFLSHNDWKTLVFLFIVPNGIWIVLPLLCMVATGQIMIDHMRNGQPSEEKHLKSHMNLVEMCLNVISLIMYNRGKVGLSVLVAFMVSTMTFSKTVFYFLVSSELCGGQHFVNHNDWKSAVFLYIIPNGIWILVPFLCMVTLGNIIVDCAGNGQPTGKKTKSY
ncbi:hypothetical protein pdam_00008222 [Pocillopora damicornis]|uniref:EXPERA domain-containing protein n=2 Tax=Pocillopora damicornis TaxID=46731 RepID=A0A3M6UTR2_POCDA|nr:hypothetical protein pdam_00008222 [Pocillopora damicornis]